MGNGSAAAADGNRWRVGGAGGKYGVRANAARNSITHRVDVFDVGAGKQGRKREVDVAGLVGVKNVSAIIGEQNFPAVSVRVTIRA